MEVQENDKQSLPNSMLMMSRAFVKFSLYLDVSTCSMCEQMFSQWACMSCLVLIIQVSHVMEHSIGSYHTINLGIKKIHFVHNLMNYDYFQDQLISKKCLEH